MTAAGVSGHGNGMDDGSHAGPRRSHFFGQLWVMIKRNLLLKKRSPKIAVAEIVIPCVFLMGIAILGIQTPATSHWEYPDATTDFPVVPISYPDTSDGSFGVGENFTTFVVACSPDNDATRKIMAEATNFWTSLQPKPVFPFSRETILAVAYYNSDAEMESAYMEKSSATVTKLHIDAGVIFDDPDVNSFQYTFRFPGGTRVFSGSIPSHDRPYIVPPTASSCRSNTSTCQASRYDTSGFVALQNVITAAYLKVRYNVTDGGLKLSTRRMPIPPSKAMSTPSYFEEMTVAVLISNMLGMSIVFLVITLVTEKEKRHIVNMEIMGLRPIVYYISWVIIYLMEIIVFSVAACLIVKYVKVWPNSDLLLLLVVNVVFGASLIVLSFCVAAFFKRPLIAGVVTYGLVAGLSMLSLVELLVSGMTTTGRWFMTLSSPTAFFMALQRVGKAEGQGHGKGFGNAMDPETVYKTSFSLGTAVIMIAVDIILYSILAIYLEKVFPSDGSPKERPWFFLLPSYWLHTCRKRSSLEQGSNNDQTHSADIELVPPEMHSRVALSIRGLRKVFPGAKNGIAAVHGFTHDMYEDEILAVLGPNGAGKTTLINMITGILGPTSGTALVYGQDITHSEQLEKARTMIGICPQHDVLFDAFTVREHINFFARLKGFSDKQTRLMFEKIIDQIGMRSQADVQAHKLSGGQKRRLSIAIAVIGEPRILVLDEPTSGVDPYNRRFLWDMIRDMRQGRCIIITTQSMQEADVFADRKLIVTQGKLLCAGTSLFLKTRFGLGYHLTLSVEHDFDESAVVEFIISRVQGARKVRAHASEISFVLPKSEIAVFPNLFNEMDAHLNRLRIRTYGVSLTTMEEIFLKLTEDDTGADSDPSNPLPTSMVQEPPVRRNHADLATTTFSRPIKGTVSNWAKFAALLKIRFLLLLRSKMVWAFGIAIPFLLVIMTGILTGLISNNLSQSDDSSELHINELGKDFDATGTKFMFFNETSNTTLDRLLGKLTELAGPYSAVRPFSTLLDHPPHYFGYMFENDTSFNANGWTNEAVICYNASARHSIPYAVNQILNAQFRLRTGSQDIFRVTSRPFPERYSSSIFSSSYIGFASRGLVIYVAMAVAVIPGVFGVDVCRDRTLKIRSQIRMTGCSFWLYWSSAFAVHLLQFTGSFAVIIALLYAFSVTVITDAIGYVVLLFAFYAPAVILFSYCASFIFKKAEAAAAGLPLPFTLIGVVLFTIVQIMYFDKDGKSTSLVLHKVLTFLLPFYGFFGGLLFIDDVTVRKSSAAAEALYQFVTVAPKKVPDYLDWESNISVILVAHAIHIPVFILLIIFIESRHFNYSFREFFGIVKRLPQPNIHGDRDNHTELEKPKDEDVVNERERIGSIDPKNDTKYSIVLRSLWKTFGKKVVYHESNSTGKLGKTLYRPPKAAVKNISLTFPKGEIFGLLGPNGAGKTTTISMITGEVTPTSGDIHANGFSMQSDASSALTSMGSCPQTDTIWADITLEEHLNFFATLCDLTPARSRDSIKVFTEGLHITEHLKKKAGALSGGTKRKLTFIISMIGNPPVVLLDEPSTGMDPKSKRNLWDMIMQSFGGERGAILTTHSMEEADALCNRIGIIVKGELQCLGSAQHLKDKYGSGYVLEIKLNLAHNTRSDEHKVMVNRVKTEIGRAVPGADCVEEFYNRLVFSVPKERITALGKVFASLDRAKNDLDLEEYSFSQTTIEQVFLHFAKMQDEIQEDTRNGYVAV